MADQALSETHGTAPLPSRPDRAPEGVTPAEAPTQIVPYDTSILHALPSGARIVCRYVLQELTATTADRNTYTAVVPHLQACATCLLPAAPDATTCARCGATLAGATPPAAYEVTEAFEAEQLVPSPAILDQQLEHPNLVRLVELLTYTPYGPPRAYLVSEVPAGTRLSEVPLPQPPADVLGWGVQISDALRYLHGKDLVSPGVTPAGVVVHNDTAWLANLAGARPVSTTPEDRAREQADDVAQLAASLYETLTGVYASAAGKGPLLPAGTPPEVEQAFARVLRPPAGSAPITAAEWYDLIMQARDAVTAAGPGLRIRSGRVSDVGRHRPLNEDSLAVVECQVVLKSRSAGLGVYAVADGMGGHAGGEVASALAIAVVTRDLLNSLVAPGFEPTDEDMGSAEVSDVLTGAVQRANMRIHEEREGRGTDMGTTLVLAVVTGARAYIANVGDSRAYVLHPGFGQTPSLSQVTVDHSVVQRLVSMGQISATDAKQHPFRNMIYKSLGERPQVEPDLFVETLIPGTRILLCSDGLSGMVPDTRIAEILAAENDPQVACTRLVEAANNAGGVDNITAVTIYAEAA